MRFFLLATHVKRTTSQASLAGIHMHICIGPRFISLDRPTILVSAHAHVEGLIGPQVHHLVVSAAVVLSRLQYVFRGLLHLIQHLSHRRCDVVVDRLLVDPICSRARRGRHKHPSRKLRTLCASSAHVLYYI